MINALEVIVTFLLTLSLASERLVTMVKTLVPWLAQEQKTPAQEVDLTADRPRRLTVQMLALLAAWVTSGLVVSGVSQPPKISLADFSPFAELAVGSFRLPLFVVAILVSGGSAFWNSVLGYLKALKDVKQVEKASRTLSYHEQAAGVGVTAVDGGVAAQGAPAGSGTRTPPVTPRSDTPPSFDASTSARSR
jgi:hypothetical protein